MNLLVTGGCGFIGTNFVRHCLGAGGEPVARLVNLDKLTYAGNRSNLADLEGDARYVFVRGDIGDSDLTGRLLREFEVEAVVNFAAESHVDRSIDSPEPFFATNVMGTLRLLEAARRYRGELRGGRREGFRFLHVSTDEVHGSLGPEEAAFSETSPHAPNSPYAASKAAGDHIARAYHRTYGLPVVTTHCSNNYGPWQFPEKLIPLMILNALEGKPLPIYGDGGNVRDWLFVEDHCEAIRLVLKAGTVGETYHIGGGAARSNLEVVDALCGMLDRWRPRAEGGAYAALKQFVEDRPGHDRRYAMDFSKLRSELGWEPKHDFESGLETTVQWYLEHGAWCKAIGRGRYNRERLGLAARALK